MTVARGEAIYSTGGSPCTGRGLRWSGDELDAALDGPVAAVLFDHEGQADIEEILRGVVETAFEQDGLRGALSDPGRIEDWRVGEAIAETWLTDHRSCYFPWPVGRDERKRGSSLPGADLVGLHADAHGDCLAFGEVKTSSDPRHPPRSMYGPKGLERQLEDLRDNTYTRDHLFMYLGHRARGTDWMESFRRAAKRYLSNKSDVRLFGFLVRDVAADQNDIRVRVERLCEACPYGTRIELLALYLPIGRLKGIGAAAVAAGRGGLS